MGRARTGGGDELAIVRLIERERQAQHREASVEDLRDTVGAAAGEGGDDARVAEQRVCGEGM